MRLVSATGGRFGKALIAEVLHGANTEKIRQFHLDDAPGYGVVAEVSIKRIKTSWTSWLVAATWRNRRVGSPLWAWAPTQVRHLIRSV